MFVLRIICLEMKFISILLILLYFADLKAAPRVKRNRALQKAFMNISEHLAKRNHEVTLVVDKSTDLIALPFALECHKKFFELSRTFQAYA